MSEAMTLRAATRDIPGTAASVASGETASSVPASTPAILEGTVTHRRRSPREHAFTYRTFMLRLPLARLEDVQDLGLPLARRGRVTFDPGDHGPVDGPPALTWIRDLLRAHDVAGDGEIVLYAFPRMLGYAFKPVSFFACHDRAGTLRAVVAEVHNTFGERHAYLLTAPAGGAIRDGVPLTARKSFHVSPFCEVRGHYAFRFFFGADRWLARIDHHAQAGGPLLETWIEGRATPLTHAAIRRLPWRYGFFTAAVVARIHLQAATLWLKRVPRYRKPPPPATSCTTSSDEPFDPVAHRAA